MRAGFWNIRGFGAPGWQTQIKDLIRLAKLDFVGLQETIKANLSQADLRRIDPNGRFVWHHTLAVGRSRGMLLGVNQDTFEVLEWTGGVLPHRSDDPTVR